jgi:hypothetical protein
MKPRPALIVSNIAGLLALIAALWLVGWQEALFGLGLLVILDLLVVLRERQARSENGSER